MAAVSTILSDLPRHLREAVRYELFCRRLVLERHYDSAAFLLSESQAGLKGDYTEPADAPIIYMHVGRSINNASSIVYATGNR